MGNWEKKTVLMKSKIFTVPTNVQFKLADYTGGVPWSEHVVEAGVTNMEHGFDTYSIETEVVKTGDDTYYTRIWRQGVVLNTTPHTYSIPVSGFGEPVHTIVNEVNFGGISMAIQVYDCIPPLRVIVVVNDMYPIVDQIVNYSSFSVSPMLKVPPTDYVTGTVRVQLIPQTGTAYATTRADITFFKFYKVKNQISGTTNIKAYEV